MFQLFEYGQIVLDTMNKVGDFLMKVPEQITVYNPAIFFLGKVPVIGGFIENVFGDGSIISFAWPFGDVSIAEMLVGSLLIFVLSFRLIKFFVDIIL